MITVSFLLILPNIPLEMRKKEKVERLLEAGE